jgi:hypothetical protein
MKMNVKMSSLLITFLLLFSLLLPFSLAENFEITLHKGWNAISIPYETFSIVRIDKDIYPEGYVYEAGIGSYRVLSLYSLSKQVGAIWVYSFKEGSKMIIDGWTPTTFPHVLSKKIYTFTQKPTWNFVPVPKGNLRASDLKLICENIRIYYFNASENCWYSYNISSKEYKRFCKDKWEDLGILEDFEYPEGIGIWLKIDKSCHSNFLAQAATYQKSCESDSVRGQPDDGKCDDGEACMPVSTSTSSDTTVIVWKCIPCEKLNGELAGECKPEKHPKCGLQTWISQGWSGPEEKKFCTAASRSQLIRCDVRECGVGQRCCAKTGSFLCYDPRYHDCKDGNLICKEEACDDYCRTAGAGSGSCSYSFSKKWPVDTSFPDGNKERCWCERALPSQCTLSHTEISPQYFLSQAEIPKQISSSFILGFSEECYNVIIKVIDENNNEKGRSTTSFPSSCSNRNNCEVSLTFTVDRIPATYSIIADKGGGITEKIGEIKLSQKEEEASLYLALEPYKDSYKIGESVKIRLKGYSKDFGMTATTLYLANSACTSTATCIIQIGEFIPAGGGMNETIVGPVTFVSEARREGNCFYALGSVAGHGVTSNSVCVEVKGRLSCSLEGEACGNGCCQGLVCINNVCQKPRGEREKCENDNWCSSGLKCDPTYHECVDPTKFSCENGEGNSHDLLYKNAFWRSVLYAEYCCEGNDDCQGFSACVLTQRCKSLPLPPTCQGSISFDIDPTSTYPSGRVRFKVSGLQGSACNGKTVYIGLYKCDTQNPVTTCTYSTSTQTSGCGGEFSAPSTAGDHTYYACVDINGDGDFNDEGEVATKTLTVKSCKREGESYANPQDCCPGLIAFQASCVDPSKYKCKNGKVYYGEEIIWDCTSIYCCENPDYCQSRWGVRINACCSPNQCPSTTTTTTTSTTTTTTTSTTTTTVPSTQQCSGSISLSLTPNPASTGATITASATGLSNCNGRTIAITRDRCGGTAVCICTSGSTGCSCTFTAPSQEGSYTYYAEIDKNNNGDYSDEGECSSPITLNVKSSQTSTSTTTTTVPSTQQCSDILGACLSSEMCKRFEGTCYKDKLDCQECCCIESKYTPQARAILSTSLSLKSGWNLISFPFVDYVISQMKDVYPSVYSYDPATSSYEKVEITKTRRKGFWVYAFKDTSIEIMGTQALYPENISLIANKPNLIPIPKDGLRVVSQRGSCKIIKFHYFNSTDQAWYRWNATSGEYSRFNPDKKAYEVVKIDKDPFIPEGLAIFLYTENDCKLSS